jgi:hypothetical protein
MKKLFATVLSVAVAMSLSPALTSAQSTSCPAEVAQAKAMLSKKQVASINSQDVQAPRSLAGARSNDNVQSPRGNQDVQSPRGNQDVQAPRSLAGARSNDSVQSPRGNQDVQSPRGNQNVQSPRSGSGATASSQAPRADISKAASLVKDAEAACKTGNMTMASEKAKAAIELLK